MLLLRQIQARRTRRRACMERREFDWKQTLRGTKVDAIKREFSNTLAFGRDHRVRP